MTHLTQQEALDLMVTASDVDDWNQKRALVKDNIDPVQFRDTIILIDSFGLCSQVLAGKNHPMLLARLNSIHNNHDKPYLPVKKDREED